MQDKQEEKTEHISPAIYAPAAFLTLSLAAYSSLRRGNYRVALELYKRGGGGLNVYQGSKRLAGMDYHPFWDKKSGGLVTRLHYHRGEGEEIKKHRPYDGW